MAMTLGQILINDALPLKYRDYERTLTKDEVDKLLETIAHDHPEQYRDIAHHFVQHGRETSFLEGATIKLSDLLPVMDKQEMLRHVDEQETAVRANKQLTAEQKEEVLSQVYGEVEKHFTDQTYAAAERAGNPLAVQVKSKAKGNRTQLAQLLTTPSVYQDPSGRTVPLFIRHSFAEGLTSAEYWAATHGARTGLVSTKLGTREGGYLGKQLGVAAITQIVTQDDCGTPYGVPVAAADPDNIGSVLARPALGFPAGTVVDKRMLGEFEKSKLNKVVVRSPMTCMLPEGLCKICVGHRENGRFPNIGDNIGLNAASAIAERIAQGALNVKHQGKKNKGEAIYAGFPVIEQLVQIPENFPHRAALADVDGKVESIEPAPQGGTNVMIASQLHHVPQENELRVNIGDELEQGDQLSSGVVNPAEITRYKGIGEGRRYFAERFTQALRESKFDVSRRNAEIISRALIDNVQVEDPEGVGSYLPGDIVSYSGMANTYKPRATAQRRPLAQAVGQYLETPVLHHTVGTRVTKQMAKDLKEFGIADALVHEQAPGFSPRMVSLVKKPQYERDWMAQLGSNYLEDRLLKSVHRGATSETHGLHPLPGMARTTEFGEQKKKDVFTY